jgi:biopolymer transport protein ExbB
VGNLLIDTFLHGGVLMWPLLVLSLVTLAVVIERSTWWSAEGRGKDDERLDRLYQALAVGDAGGALELAQGSADARIRVVAHGLEHAQADVGIAMQVKVAEETKLSRRFLVVLDTAITLAPLLGLLGTVTGIMRSFHFVGGDQELAAAKVSGGIGEALIATAFGLGIAITTLIPYNAFGNKAEELQHELETVVNNVRLVSEKARQAARSAVLTGAASE